MNFELDPHLIDLRDRVVAVVGDEVIESTQRPLPSIFDELPGVTCDLGDFDDSSVWPYGSVVDNATGDPTNWW